ncbi:MAG: TIGR03067 domain-containing protein [Candidatus Eisenbacteria bacterium]
MTSNDTGKPTPAGELTRMAGAWRMVSAVRDGQPLGEEFVNAGRMAVDGDVTTVTFRGLPFMKGRTTLDPSAAVASVDYLLLSPPGRGKVQRGRYEWDGEALRICVAPPGRERPADTRTRAGDDLTLMCWTRLEDGTHPSE